RSRSSSPPPSPATAAHDPVHDPQGFRPGEKAREGSREPEPPGGCQGCGCREDMGWDLLAERLVQVCAAVKEGEVVQLGGGIHAFPLLEALALAVRRAGAYPEINATSHRLLTRTVAETPLPYLA